MDIKCPKVFFTNIKSPRMVQVKSYIYINNLSKVRDTILDFSSPDLGKVCYEECHTVY